MRYAGLLLLVFGSVLVGRAYAARLLCRPSLKSALAELLDELCIGARCYLKPYKKTLSELKPKDGRIAELARLLSDSPKMQDGYAAWRGRKELDEDTDGELSALFGKLGGAELSHELSLLCSVRDRLSTAADQALEKARSEGRAAVVISVAAGLGCALLLL